MFAVFNAAMAQMWPWSRRDAYVADRALLRVLKTRSASAAQPGCKVGVAPSSSCLQRFPSAAASLTPAPEAPLAAWVVLSAQKRSLPCSPSLLALFKDVLPSTQVRTGLTLIKRWIAKKQSRLGQRARDRTIIGAAGAVLKQRS